MSGLAERSFIRQGDSLMRRRSRLLKPAKGDMKEEILKLYEISKILKEKRFKNGSVNFEREEVKFHLAEDGTPTGVYFQGTEGGQLAHRGVYVAGQ